MSAAASVAAPRVYRWRVVDIVIAAVVAVVSGVIFWVWIPGQTALSIPTQALLPGFQGILNGPWLFAGVLGGLIVRKPGAAVFVELVAAALEALLGNQWGGWLTLLSGAAQGLGAEVVFAAFGYRRWGWPVALLAGVGTGVAESIVDITVWYPAYDGAFKWVYALSTTVSGALVAGLCSWLLLRAIAATGALNRFASGRAAERV